MNPREAKIFKDLLESVGISFNSKGTYRDTAPKYYGIEDKELTSPLSNKEFNRRNFALTESGQIIQAGSPAVTDIPLMPTPMGNVMETGVNALTEAHPLAGIVAGLATGKVGGKKAPLKADNSTLSYGYSPKSEYLKGYNIKADSKAFTPDNMNAIDISQWVDHMKGVMPKKITPAQQISMDTFKSTEKQVRDLNKFWNPKETNQKYMLVMGENNMPSYIPMDDFKKRLGNDYPWFQDEIGEAYSPSEHHLSQIPGFGAFRNVASDKGLMQYGSQRGLMHDIDHLSPSGTSGEHFSERLQITHKDGVGQTMDNLERIVAENPNSYYAVGQTGGGMRIWDLSEGADRFGKKSIGTRQGDMLKMGNDNLYTEMSTDKNVKRIKEIYKSLGKKVPSSHEIIYKGIKDEQIAEAWKNSVGIHSDVRYQEKPSRIVGYRNENYDGGPPMGFQPMFELGNQSKINAQLYFGYRQHNDIMNRLREAQGLTEPGANWMGLGVRDSKYLDHTLKNMSPKWQEVLRKNWKLGLTGGLLPSLTEDD